VPASVVIAPGGPDPLGAPGALDPGLAHQPAGLVTADIDPGTPGGLP